MNGDIITTPVILTAIPVFFLFIFAEILAVRYFNRRSGLHAKDDSVSIFMGLFSVLTNGVGLFDLAAGWAQLSSYVRFDLDHAHCLFRTG